MHGNWGIRWFSADGGAKQGVCRGYSGRLFIWTIIGQRTKVCIACLADLQLMCKRDYARMQDSHRAPSSRDVPKCNCLERMKFLVLNLSENKTIYICEFVQHSNSANVTIHVLTSSSRFYSRRACTKVSHSHDGDHLCVNLGLCVCALCS